MDRRTLNRIEQNATEVLAGAGYRALEPFGERHGCWEVRFVLPLESGHHRGVSVAVCEDRNSRRFLEVWAGAQKGPHFRRRLVADMDISASMDELRDGIRRAITTASRLRPTPSKAFKLISSAPDGGPYPVC